MCLVIKNKKKTKPVKASKDIICFKRLIKKPYGQKGYRTPHQYTEVNIGSRGSRLKATLGIQGNRVNEGIHAYTTEDRAKQACWYGGIVVMATIPKGAKYLIGKSKDIVATELKLGKIIYKKNY